MINENDFPEDVRRYAKKVGATPLDKVDKDTPAGHYVISGVEMFKQIAKAISTLACCTAISDEIRSTALMGLATMAALVRGVDDLELVRRINHDAIDLLNQIEQAAGKLPGMN